MNSAPSPTPQRANPLRYSLKSLLIVVLIASAYYAGRAPMVHRVERAERERYEALKDAQQSKERAQEYAAAAVRAYQHNNLRHVDEGMTIDALEHQQRFSTGTIPIR
jgi:hypothetical protein